MNKLNNQQVNKTEFRQCMNPQILYICKKTYIRKAQDLSVPTAVIVIIALPPKL